MIKDLNYEQYQWTGTERGHIDVRGTYRDGDNGFFSVRYKGSILNALNEIAVSHFDELDDDLDTNDPIQLIYFILNSHGDDFCEFTIHFDDVRMEIYDMSYEEVFVD